MPSSPTIHGIYTLQRGGKDAMVEFIPHTLLLVPITGRNDRRGRMGLVVKRSAHQIHESPDKAYR